MAKQEQAVQAVEPVVVRGWVDQVRVDNVPFSRLTFGRFVLEVFAAVPGNDAYLTVNAIDHEDNTAPILERPLPAKDLKELKQIASKYVHVLLQETYLELARFGKWDAVELQGRADTLSASELTEQQRLDNLRKRAQEAADSPTPAFVVQPEAAHGTDS